MPYHTIPYNTNCCPALRSSYESYCEFGQSRLDPRRLQRVQLASQRCMYVCISGYLDKIYKITQIDTYLRQDLSYLYYWLWWSYPTKRKHQTIRQDDKPTMIDFPQMVSTTHENAEWYGMMLSILFIPYQFKMRHFAPPVYSFHCFIWNDLFAVYILN